MAMLAIRWFRADATAFMLGVTRDAAMGRNASARLCEAWFVKTKYGMPIVGSLVAPQALCVADVSQTKINRRCSLPKQIANVCLNLLARAARGVGMTLGAPNIFVTRIHRASCSQTLVAGRKNADRDPGSQD